MIGTINSEGGRPLNVYANRLRPAVDTLRHEVLLTDVLLQYEEQADCVRDPKRINKRIRPDAEMWVANRLFYVELDTGTESHRQVAERQSLYEITANLLPETDANGNLRYGDIDSLEDVFVLFVTTSERRLENLIEKSDRLAPLAMFSTVGRVADDPYGCIWHTCDGKQVSLLPSQKKGIFGNSFFH